MSLPKHSPVLPLSHNDTYDQNVRCYGNPPKGYRWLKVGDPVSEKTLMVSWGSFIPYNKDWDRHPRDKVALNEWPAIEPIAKSAKVILGSNSFCVRGKDPKPNTPLYNLNKDLLPMNAPATTVKTLKYKIVTRQNGLVAVQITEQSHRNKEFGESAFYFGKLRSDGSPEVTASTFYVRGVGSSADDKPMLFTDSQFEEFEKEVAAYNSHFSKPAILKVVFFEYSAGSVHGYRRVEVVKEDSTYLEGIDSKKGEYRKFLKSKIIGPVDTVKA